MQLSSTFFRWSFIVAAFWLFILLWLIAIRPQPEMRRWREWYLDNDFAHYYITAALFKQGENPYAADLRQHYSRYGFKITRPIDRATNPPSLVLLTAPLTFLAPQPAFWLWTTLQFLALAISVLVGTKLLGLKLHLGERISLLVGAHVMFGTVHHCRYGQTQALMLLLFILGFGYLRRSSVRHQQLGAGLCGLGASLKLFPLPLIYVIWRRGGLRCTTAFVAGALLLTVPALLLAGPGTAWDYLTRSIPYIQEVALRYSGNISLSGALFHTAQILTGGDSPHLVALVPVMRAVSFFILVLLLVLDYRQSRNRLDVLISGAVCLVASSILGPTCWSHYVVLFVFPFLVLLQRSLEVPRRAMIWASMLALYISLGITAGMARDVARGIRYLTAWWGVVCSAGMLLLLFVVRRLPRSSCSSPEAM